MSKAILLNTGWTFTKEGHDEPVTLPHTWNAVDGQDGGNDYYRGTCSYTRNLEKPELSDGDRAVLQFDGVAMTAVVSLNGRKWPSTRAATPPSVWTSPMPCTMVQMS